MIRVSNSLYRGATLTAILALAFVAGCKKKEIAPPPPPPAPPPAAAKPTVSIQANPTSINKGDSSTLSWTSTDATTLTVSPEVGAVTAQGSTKVTPSDSTTYTITASGPGGSADSSVRVTVAAPPPPPPPQAAPDMNKMFLEEVKDAYFDFNKADIAPTPVRLSPRPRIFFASTRRSRPPSKATAMSVARPNTTSSSAIAAPLPSRIISFSSASPPIA